MISGSPFINLPFPARQHPESARIETSTRDWVIRFRLACGDAGKQGLVQGRFGEAAAYGYPDAPLPEAELAAGWCSPTASTRGLRPPGRSGSLGT